MSRHFTGSAHDRVDFAPGAIAALDGGPMSAAVLWRPTTVHDGTIFQSSNGAGFEVWGLFAVSDSHTWHSIAGSFRSLNTYASGGWRIDGFSKPDGAGQMVRGHSATLGGAWTHADSTTCNDAGAGPGTGYIRVGDNNLAGMGLNADVAAIVICAGEWSDATFETLASGLLAWDVAVGSTPAALWAFNQASTSDPIADITGGGADQTAISGTSIGDDPAGWSYALAEPVSVTVSSSTGVPTASGSADVTPTAVTATATAPAVLSTAVVEVANPTGIVASGSTGAPSSSASVTVVPPSLWPNSEIVAVGWLRDIDGLSASMVSTKLPRDMTSWAEAGFVTVGNGLAGAGGITGGSVDGYTHLRSPTVSVHAWANNPSSGKPPLGKAARLLELVWRGCCDGSAVVQRQVSLPPGYFPARVLQAYLLGEPRRIPGDEASLAHFQVDLQLHWVALS